MTPTLTDLPPNGHAPSPAVPFWAALIDDAPSPIATPDLGDARAGAAFIETGASPAPDPTGAGSVASVDVVFVDLTAAGGGIDGRLGMIAAQALRRGGILTVLTRCRRHPGPDGALLDSTGAIVAAAQNADLLYLQHIVIPTDRLRPTPPIRTDADRAEPDPDRPGGHAIAHADLLVFAQPRTHGGAHPHPAESVALEAGAAESVGASR